MAEICSCKTGIVNFGQPKCINAFKRTSRLVFVDYRDDAGAVNSIKSTDVLDQTFFDDKLNGAVDKRWYLTNTISGVDGERADATTQEVDGINRVVRQGTRSFNGTFWGGIASPTFMKALESISCRQMGLFIIDVEGSIIGIEKNGELYPIKVQRNTFQSKYMFPTADLDQGINLKFDWEENERDSEISMIGANNITVDMSDQTAMSTVIFEDPATGISTTTATVKMHFDYGEVFDKEPYEGALLADFVLLDNVGVPIVITSVTPTATPGEYDIVFPLQVSTDVLTLSYSKVTGIGFETVTDLSILIP